MQHLIVLNLLSFPAWRMGLLGGWCPGRVWVIREVMPEYLLGLRWVPVGASDVSSGHPLTPPSPPCCPSVTQTQWAVESPSICFLLSVFPSLLCASASLVVFSL